jgi:hypothetical protein
MLQPQAKSMLGAMLDYSNVNRQMFAESWATPINPRLATE